MWYFAYGSNLNQDDLDGWCAEKRLPLLNLSAKPWKRATLTDHMLVFDCFSKRRNSVAANIRSSPGEIVRGVAFELSDEEFRIIARKEGAPRTYTEVDVELAVEDGSPLQAKTFYCRPGTEQANQNPCGAYVNLIIEGAVAYSLDDTWLEKLRRTPTA